MWLMTTRGFYSVVRKPEDGLTGVTVRARCKEDIDALAELLPSVKPFKTKWTDYPWRLRCTAAEWSKVCALLALEIDYSNFKDEVKRLQGGKRASVYSRVWGALLSLEHPGRRAAEQRRLDEWYAARTPSVLDEGDDYCAICGLWLAHDEGELHDGMLMHSGCVPVPQEGDPLDDSFLGHVVGCRFSVDSGWDCHPNCTAGLGPERGSNRGRRRRRRRSGARR